MNPYTIYQTHMALKFHFASSKYDYFKCRGKPGKGATPEKYEKNTQQRAIYRRLSKTLTPSDLPDCLLANILVNANFMIHNYDTRVYMDFKKRNQALTNTFTEELKILAEKANGSFLSLVKDGDQEPPILHMLYDETISWETFCILNHFIGFIKVLDENIAFPLLWEDARNKVIKYTPFVLKKIDKEKYKKLLTSELIDVINRR